MFFKGMYRTVQVHAGTECIKKHGTIIVYGALCVSAYYHWDMKMISLSSFTIADIESFSKQVGYYTGYKIMMNLKHKHTIVYWNCFMNGRILQLMKRGPVCSSFFELVMTLIALCNIII